jgi:hypothetical protein
MESYARGEFTWKLKMMACALAFSTTLFLSGEEYCPTTPVVYKA